MKKFILVCASILIFASIAACKSGGDSKPVDDKTTPSVNDSSIVQTDTIVPVEEPELFPIKVGDKWGYADKDSIIRIKPIYQEAKPFVDGEAEVCISNEHFTINKNGDFVDHLYEDHIIEEFNDTITIHGVLTDSATHEPIPFANVVFRKNNKRFEDCMTNQDGEFQCTLPEGKYKIELTSLGYHRKLLEIEALYDTDLDTIPMSECKNCSIISFSIDTTSK